MAELGLIVFSIIMIVYIIKTIVFIKKGGEDNE